MSPVVRVRPTTAGAVPLPQRLELGLAELLVAARLAGVPLPFGEPCGSERLATRLADGSPAAARERVAVERRRAEDPGPSGALEGLRQRGLVDARGALAPPVAAALACLASGPLAVVLDVAVRRRGGEARLRSWHGVTAGLVARLTLLGPTAVELGWADPRRWAQELGRQVRVTPWVPQPAPLALPAYVELPTGLLLGSLRAQGEQRPALLSPLARAQGDRVRLADAGAVRAAAPEEVLGLLQTLGGCCRGRLRLLATRRDREPQPQVATWLLLDDGWHDLRPGRRATAVLRRRRPGDLGLDTWPLVEGLVGEGWSGRAGGGRGGDGRPG